MAIFDRHTLLVMNIVEEMGLEALPEEEKDKILRAMVEVLGQRITLRAIEVLADSDAKTFSDLVDRDPDRAGQFLAERVPNVGDLVRTEIAKFKEDLTVEFHSA